MTLSSKGNLNKRRSGHEIVTVTQLRVLSNSGFLEYTETAIPKCSLERPAVFYGEVPLDKKVILLKIKVRISLSLVV